MKKQTFIFLFSLCLPFLGQAQVLPDSVRIHEYISIKHTDAFPWVTRYQGDIDRYTDENRKLQDKSCDVLFLGSSSINLWENIYNDMAPMKIIRRSYGGATIRDMLYNYDVIARGYQPRSIVLYVENDVCGSPEDLTVGEAFDFFRVFIGKIRCEYPDTPFYILSLKPSFAREKMIPKQQFINSLLEEYAGITPNLFFVDVASCLYNSNGTLRTDIFKEDNLHMNQIGYDLWTARLKPLLIIHSCAHNAQAHCGKESVPSDVVR